jgi:hypothetical protein
MTVATATHQEAAYDDVAGSGWLTFAASMLGLVGILCLIDGIVGLSKSKFYAAGATYVFSDLRTWSWITLIVGVLAIMAAGGVLAGSQWARWFGLFAAGLNAIAVFSSAQGFQLWTLIIFACDILVIYALAVYGGRRSTG